MVQRVLPTALAFLVSDYIIDDVNTRKKSIIGLFNNICSSRFPFRHPEMNVFISLTDGHGKYQSSLICTRSEDEQEVFKTKGEVVFNNPNTVVEINFNLRNVEFPSPGKYTFQFFCDHGLLIMRPFEVVQLKQDEKK